MANPDLGDKTPHAQPEPGPANVADSMPRRRPFSVTLLLWLVLSLSAWGLLRLSGALRWWDVLYQNDARLGPLYLALTGAAWLLGGVVLIWSLFWIKRWAYVAVPIAVLVWLLEYWVERIFFEGPRSNLSFAIAASAAIFALTCISAFHRKTKIYLTKSEEHEQPDEYSTSS